MDDITSLRAKRSNPYKIMKSGKHYYVYFIANKTNVALYIGVTSNLEKRVFENKNKLAKGFTEKYDINKLVYYEIYDDPENAILREKRLKGSSRSRKNKLVESLNPLWQDLYDQIL